jgi:hypothetical protein
MAMIIHVFWAVTLGKWVIGTQDFKGTYFLQLQKGDKMQKLQMNYCVKLLCTHIHTHTQSTQHMLTWYSETPGSLKDKPGTFL